MADHPSDTTPMNSTVEIKTTISDSIALKNLSNYKYKTSDNFYVVDFFGRNGLASGKIDTAVFGLLTEIRIRILKDDQNWIVIHEIALFD